MGRRRKWRNKPLEEKERRRAFNLKKRPALKMVDDKVSDMKLDPAIIDSHYRRLSSMTREIVDNLVATGLSIEKVINGIRN